MCVRILTFACAYLAYFDICMCVFGVLGHLARIWLNFGIGSARAYWHICVCMFGVFGVLDILRVFGVFLAFGSAPAYLAYLDSWCSPSSH